MAPNHDELRARLFLNAALPLAKVVREDNPLMYKLTRNLKGIVQFMVKGTDTGAALVFEDDTLNIHKGIHENPTVTLVFKDLKALNGFFSGKPDLPSMPNLLIDSKGLWRLDILARVVPLLLSLQMLMPEADPKDPQKRALKVKMLLYMVTTALSQLNKAGEPSMKKLTEKSPDRVYQWVVEGGPCAYLRMKAGKTKAGRGVYKRRRPFVLMKFPDIEGAYQVLTSKAALVDAVKNGYVVTEGAMEYSKEIGLRMQFIEELLA